jgi:hypothetical protein
LDRGRRPRVCPAQPRRRTGLDYGARRRAARATDERWRVRPGRPLLGRDNGLRRDARRRDALPPRSGRHCDRDGAGHDDLQWARLECGRRNAVVRRQWPRHGRRLRLRPRDRQPVRPPQRHRGRSRRRCPGRPYRRRGGPRLGGDVGRWRGPPLHTRRRTRRARTASHLAAHELLFRRTRPLNLFISSAQKSLVGEPGGTEPDAGRLFRADTGIRGVAQPLFSAGDTRWREEC